MTDKNNIKIDQAKGTVTINVHEKACPFCKKKVRGLTPEEFTANMETHIAGCKIAQTLLNWERRGIKKEMIAMLTLQDLESKLQKLIKKHGFDKVKDTLNGLEEIERHLNSQHDIT